MFDRIEQMIGEKNLNKFKKAKILLVGLGGVGGTTFETLIRSGFCNITIIDYDTFEESNLNRQILSNVNVLGHKKVNVAKARGELINQNIKIISKDLFLDETSIKNLNTYDYIIDACDSTPTKIALIKFAKENNIKIISSMGMGNRVDPTKIIITKLSKTSNDPLAKKVRNLLKKENCNIDIPVITSLELPVKSKNVILSMMPVPAVAGIYLAYYVINDLIKK